MSASTGAAPHSGSPDLRRAVIRRMVQVIVVMLIQMAVVFAAAGSLDWPWAWIFFGAYLGILLVNLAVLVPRQPELIAERGRVREEAKQWDKVLAGFVSLWGPLVVWIVCGLDRRLSWSADYGTGFHIAALVLTVAGFGIVTWSMASNSFFSGVVSIQADRGHSVASSGPYRLVRHPGYVGMILFTLMTPLVIGTVWGLIPAAVVVGLHVLRTALEDRTLQAELPGYKEYASRTRYRLIPGIY